MIPSAAPIPYRLPLTAAAFYPWLDTYLQAHPATPTAGLLSIGAVSGIFPLSPYTVSILSPLLGGSPAQPVIRLAVIETRPAYTVVEVQVLTPAFQEYAIALGAALPVAAAPPPRPLRSPATAARPRAERDAAIFQRHQAGTSHQDLAGAYHLTPDYISEIVAQESRQARRSKAAAANNGDDRT